MPTFYYLLYFMRDFLMVLVFYDNLRVISAYFFMLAISLVLEGDQMSAEFISKTRAQKCCVCVIVTEDLFFLKTI